MIRWKYFPASQKLPELLNPVIAAFEANESSISSAQFQLKSDEVLAHIADDLEKAHFLVERGKTKAEKIRVPVLYGENGQEALSFEVDAYNPDLKAVLEVEAGRGFTNYQFLKDFFECCMMQETDYFCVAIRQDYRGHKDYESVCSFFSALYASRRLTLPLKGLLVIGY